MKNNSIELHETKIYVSFLMKIYVFIFPVKAKYFLSICAKHHYVKIADVLPFLKFVDWLFPNMPFLLCIYIHIFE